MKLVEFFLTFFIFISEGLFPQSLKEIFDRNINIRENEMNVQEFFNYLSKELKIDFIFISKYPEKIKIDGFKNKPIRILLRSLEEIGYQFILKFEKGNIYIEVNSNKFSERINPHSNSNLLDIDLKNALVKDLFKTLEEFTGKNFIIKNEEILSKKITMKCKKKWEDVLEDASKILNFRYKIEGSSVVIE